MRSVHGRLAVRARLIRPPPLCTGSARHQALAYAHAPPPLYTQGLRALRAIKPLRMLTRSAGMRMVFKSIVLSLAAMANVSIVLIIFFFIFAILGTQLFMGLLARCGAVWGMCGCVN